TAITDDASYEIAETFTLLATNTGGTAAEGVATIRDDGTGGYFAADDNDGSPTLPPGVLLDDDRALQVAGFQTNEASPFTFFSVQGAANQLVGLTLTAGTATAGADYTASMEYSTDGGKTWNTYTSGNVVLSAAGTMLVRVPVLQDSINEPDETFTLTATNTGGAGAIGTATIVDDANGTVFNPDGTENLKAAKDDDRNLRIENITVNEASPYGVFRITGETGQQIQLSLEAAGSGSGYATLGTDTGTQLQYFDGFGWKDYAPGAFVTYPSGSTTLLVRVAINNDTPYEGPETFLLKGSVPAQGIESFGTGTIGDDGTGAIYNESGAQDFKAPKDDDRALKVDSIRVNEGSTYGIFTVSLVDTSSGIRLELIQETAVLAPDAQADTAYLDGVPLQYYNGSQWVNYTGEFIYGDTALGKTLLVRTGIANDTAKEGAETFQLRVVQGGYGAAIGIATILDDGTGVKYTGAVTPAGLSETSTQNLDDDFDKDGIAPNVEEILATMSASTGNGGLNGDLNGDGKQDSEQNSLATLAWITADQFNSAIDGTLTEVKPIITLGVVDSSGVADDNSYQLEAISVLPPTSEETGGAKPEGVYAPWDAIRFTVSPVGEALVDVDGARLGVQISIYIDVSRSGLV
ncbi:Calx-beta domain-containing protein, partial [Zwartia sp.]|uniref:Calx-beta domain-containing protein n=1 Tax=Zwartia sp. TaxID=2978004 RepID=UPI002716391D